MDCRIERGEEAADTLRDRPRACVVGDERACQRDEQDGERAARRMPARLVEPGRRRVQRKAVNEGGREVSQRTELVAKLTDSPREQGQQCGEAGPHGDERRARKEVGEGDGPQHQAGRGKQRARVALPPVEQGPGDERRGRRQQCEASRPRLEDRAAVGRAESRGAHPPLSSTAATGATTSTPAASTGASLTRVSLASIELTFASPR